MYDNQILAFLERHPNLLNKFYRLMKTVWREGDIIKVVSGPLKGTKLSCHPDRLSQITGRIELDRAIMMAILAKEMSYTKRGNDVVHLDIGANLGYFSLLLARYSSQSQKVYAFEPIPVNYDRMLVNINVNGLRDRIIHMPFAVHSQNKLERFYVGVWPMRASNSKEWAEAGGSESRVIDVRCVNMDDFLASKHVTDLGVVKIDIEGGAADALKGMRKSIAKFRPVIVIESHTEEESKEILEVLTNEVDYRGYAIDHREHRKEKVFEILSDKSLYNDVHINAVPFLLYPRELDYIAQKAISAMPREAFRPFQR